MGKIKKTDLTQRDGEIVISSRTLAERFDKQHGHVLRSIQGLECSEVFRRSNFGPANYEDARGHLRPEYMITKDGAMFLVMGWTGAKAAAWKEQLIAAFNEMQESLRKQRNNGVPWMLRADPCEWDLAWPSYVDKALCEMYGWDYKPGGRRVPQMASVRDMIYRWALGGNAYTELKKINPNPRFRSNHHQYLDDAVREKLKASMYFLEHAANKAGRNPDIFKKEMIEFFGARQIELFAK